jgi:hypothetical protein
MTKGRVAGPLAIPHSQLECYGSRLHCLIHDTDEPDGDYNCLECRHAFATEHDLTDAHNAVLRSLSGPHYRPVTLAIEVLSCPYCIHDF